MADSHLGEHLLRSTSTDERLFRLLTKLLRTNVLTWIEHQAFDEDLSRLVSVSTRFKAYLARRANHVPALEDDVKLWAKDLPRIVTEFGRNLLDFPPAIHDLIPPLCPRNSAIYSVFTTKHRCIKLFRLADRDWYDQISCTYYKYQSAKCIACRDQRYAVGLDNGLIHIYDTSTCANLVTLDQGDAVRILQFGPIAKFLGSAGLYAVFVWDLTTKSRTLVVKLNAIPLSVAFHDNDATISIASRSSKVFTWSYKSGKQIKADDLSDVLESTSP